MFRESINMFPFLLPSFVPLLIHWTVFTVFLTTGVMLLTFWSKSQDAEWVSGLWNGCVSAVCLFPFCFYAVTPWFNFPVLISTAFWHLPAWFYGFSFIYFIGVMLHVSNLFLQWHDLSKLKQNTNPCQLKPVQEMLKQNLEMLSLKKKIDLRISKRFVIPVTFGIFHPVVVIPNYAVQHLSHEQLRLLIAHELCHIKRHDYLFCMLLRTVRTFLWFVPFMPVMQSQLLQSREFRCDMEVLRLFSQRKDYAEMFIVLTEQVLHFKPFLHFKPSLHGVALFHPFNLMQERFLRIMQFQDEDRHNMIGISPVMLFVMALMACLLMNTARVSISQTSLSQIEVSQATEQPLPLSNVVIDKPFVLMDAPPSHALFQDEFPNVGDAVLINDVIWMLDNDGILQGFSFSPDRKTVTPGGRLDMTEAVFKHLNLTGSEHIHFILEKSFQSYLFLSSINNERITNESGNSVLTGGIHIVDVANPEQPQYTAHIPYDSAGGITVIQGTLYARITPPSEDVLSQHYLAAFDIQSPSKPIEKWRVPLPDNRFIFACDINPLHPTILYATGRDLLIYDMSNQPPQLLGRWEINQQRSNILFLSARERLLVLASQGAGELQSSFQSPVYQHAVLLSSPAEPQEVYSILLTSSSFPVLHRQEIISDYVMTVVGGQENHIYFSKLNGNSTLEPAIVMPYSHSIIPMVYDPMYFFLGAANLFIYPLPAVLSNARLDDWLQY